MLMRSIFALPFRPRIFSLLLSVLPLGFLWCGLAGAAEFIMPVDRPSLRVFGPAQRVLVNITRAGERLVAVGERGLIVLSDDGGDNWRQALAPVSVTLTAVEFPTTKEGWAVGHCGVILHTEDGGETWTRQLDGRMVAQIELKAAEAAGGQTGQVEGTAATRRLANAKFLVKEGADKPFFDVHFLDETRGFVVGAFGFFFGTQDGGKTWQSYMDRLDNPKEMHFFVMEGEGQNLWVAGEKGFLARSTDGGKSFTRINAPSTASYFALAVSTAGEVFLGGLQGNSYRFDDQGKTFQKIELPRPTSVNGIKIIDDGTVLLVTQSGEVYGCGRGACSVYPLKLPPNAGLSAVTQASTSTLVAVGSIGVTRFSKTPGEPGEANKEVSK